MLIRQFKLDKQMDRDQLNASTELLKLLLEVKTWQQQQEGEESRCLVHCV